MQMPACLHPWRRRVIFARTVATAFIGSKFFRGGLPFALLALRTLFSRMCGKLTWLALGEDQAARFRRVEQLIAL